MLVHDQHDALGVRIVDIDQVPHTVCPVDPRPLVTDPDLAPAAQGVGHQKQVDHPAPHVLRVVACRVPRRHGEPRPDVGQELAARLVEADDRTRRIVWALIDIKHILHVPDEVSVGCGRDAPLLFQPRFERVC